MKFFLPASIIFFLCLVDAIGQDLEPCRGESGLFGYCNSSGQAIIDYQFYDAMEFIDGHAAVMGESKWGIINESGSWMVEPTYDQVYNCQNIPDQILVKEIVKEEEKWYFVNAYGIQMTHEFEVQSPWHEFDMDGTVAYFEPDTWFAVIRKGKWGIIDIHDEVKMPFAFEWLRVVRREIAGRQGVVAMIIKDKGKYAWQRVDATAATGFNFDQFLGEYENYLFFMQGAQPVILNAITGERITETGRDYFNLINDEDSVGLVNSGGKIIVPFKYQMVDIGSIDGYAIFGSKYKKGIYSLSGDLLLPNEYKDIKLAATNPMTLSVKNQEGRVALISIASGKARNVTDFKYDYAVKDGDKIRMKMGSRMGYLSPAGEEIWNN